MEDTDTSVTALSETAPEDRTENRRFTTSLRGEVTLPDIGLVAVVPAILVGVFLFPEATREALVFETANPAVTTAYTSHFVHLHGIHLLGNITVYFVVVPVTYLLCVLSGRRQLFRITVLTLLVVFPFVLSAMQLLFPREREILGFSGINAGFFGLLCLAWVFYTGRYFFDEASEQYAPALLFLTTGVIALVTLPSRAWRLEIAAISIILGLGYLLVWVSRDGRPTRKTVKMGFNRPGYAELAGAGLGLIVAYPFVGFRDVVTLEEGVIDVYVHLLGYALAFIVVYSYATITKDIRT